ncbi:MAG: DNA-binding domain-containing protein [Dysgonamonadaceae bacterium]
MAISISTRLNVLLYDTPLTPETNDFIGRVQLNNTLDNTRIAALIVQERTEYRLETIKNILDLADNAKCNALASGYAVHSGVAQMHPSISGRFEGEKAQFDSKTHSQESGNSKGKQLSFLYTADAKYNWQERKRGHSL